MFIVTMPFQEYVNGICILLLLGDIFGLGYLGVPFLIRLLYAALIVLFMLFISGHLIRWILAALIFITVFLFALLTGLVRHYYQKFTKVEEI